MDYHTFGRQKYMLKIYEYVHEEKRPGNSERVDTGSEMCDLRSFFFFFFFFLFNFKKRCIGDLRTEMNTK